MDAKDKGTHLQRPKEAALQLCLGFRAALMANLLQNATHLLHCLQAHVSTGGTQLLRMV